MDPNATWNDACRCLTQGDLACAVDCLRDLQDWLRRGGFAPAALTVQDPRGTEAFDLVSRLIDALEPPTE